MPDCLLYVMPDCLLYVMPDCLLCVMPDCDPASRFIVFHFMEETEKKCIFVRYARV